MTPPVIGSTLRAGAHADGHYVSRIQDHQSRHADAHASVHSIQEWLPEQHLPYIADSREAHNQPLEQRMEPPPECPADADAVTAMKHRFQTAAGKAIYSNRKSTVETVFGVIKEVLGFRRFICAGCAQRRSLQGCT